MTFIKVEVCWNGEMFRSCVNCLVENQRMINFSKWLSLRWSLPIYPFQGNISFVRPNCQFNFCIIEFGGILFHSGRSWEIERSSTTPCRFLNYQRIAPSTFTHQNWWWCPKAQPRRSMAGLHQLPADRLYRQGRQKLLRDVFIRLTGFWGGESYCDAPLICFKAGRVDQEDAKKSSGEVFTMQWILLSIFLKKLSLEDMFNQANYLVGRAVKESTRLLNKV